MQGHRFSISPQRAGLALDRLRALNFDFSVRRPSLGVLSADIEKFVASHCSDAELVLVAGEPFASGKKDLLCGREKHHTDDFSHSSPDVK